MSIFRNEWERMMKLLLGEKTQAITKHKEAGKTMSDLVTYILYVINCENKPTFKCTAIRKGNMYLLHYF